MGSRRGQLPRCDSRELAHIYTCGIDETSSSELSGSINSMYKWYRDARLCFVYFADMMREESDVLSLEQVKTNGSRSITNIRCSGSTASALRKSQWFTRGWTLQELVAPREAIFVDSWWKIFGSRSMLQGLASVIIGIEHVARVNVQLPQQSVATRMS